MMVTDMKSVTSRIYPIFRKQRTLTTDEIPKLYHEPGVYTGYRLPGQSMLSYVFSAFQLNNETVNIWTHAIGFFVILVKTGFLLEQFGIEDTRISPLVGFGVCCVLNTGLSVIAHTFHSASPTIHYTCFQADYAGIGLYAFGSALHYFYLGADIQTRRKLNLWFLPVNFLLSWLCFVCCSIAKLKYRRPYPFARKLWHIVPFGFHMVLTMSLLTTRVSTCYFEVEICKDEGLYAYRNILVLAILGAVTYSSHLPEVLWPGHFDFIGQGHQVFHVVSVAVHQAQFNAAYDDIVHYKENTKVNNTMSPSLTCVVCVILGWSVCCALTIVAFRPFVARRVKADEKME